MIKALLLLKNPFTSLIKMKSKVLSRKIRFILNSLALITDSFHLLNDIISLVISLWSIKLVLKKNPSAKYTYGWQRAEVLGALINGVFLLAICLAILLEAVQKIHNPVLILIVGILGMVSNAFGLFLFHDFKHHHKNIKDKDENNNQETNEDVRRFPITIYNKLKIFYRRIFNKHMNNTLEYNNTINKDTKDCTRISPEEKKGEFGNNFNETPVQMLLDEHNRHNHAKSKNCPTKYPYRSLNMKGVFLHVLGDALGNFGVIISALFIWLSNYSWKYYADPFISMVISIIISINTLPLIKSSSLILLQVAPKDIHVEDIKEDISSISGVISIHELHIWQLSDTKLIASAHILIGFSPDNAEKYMNLIASIRQCLHAYGIHSSTIQIEFQGVYPHKAFFTENNNRRSSCCLLECVGGEECFDNRCCISPNSIEKDFVP
ncbi:unnamed protein product [Pneumocystis jirovecii]|uniref:Cation diffusion facilitator family transporter n=1 Tax=Pneumocystis jirovecii TaxID=42068 RepID=L0PCY2_PNEJI|nr:unnamed protein product [Pneumocystis jirovecii]